MIIKNVSKNVLFEALENVNLKYNNNVIWQRVPEAIGRRFRFTLRVKNSRESGAKLGFSGRRTINACWHVHGNLFDEIFKLEPKAIIKSGGNDITIEYGNWIDRNIGSIMQPMMYSNSCNCDNY